MPTDRLVGSARSKYRRRRTAVRPRKLHEERLEGRLLLAQTTGLFQNDPDASDGYVLFSPNTTNDTYLIDKQGNAINEWNFSDTPGLLGYLQEDGSLIRSAAAASGGQGGNGKIDAAGSGGRIEHVEWDGSPIWSFDYGIADTATDTRDVLQHHDIEVLPNGNILMIAWEFKTGAEAIQAGRNPLTVGSELFPDHIVEVQPDLVGGGGTIVWEWHIWDHLVQEFDITKDNFGVVADHPEKIDINYTSIGDEGGGAPDDWTHSNGIDYNAEFDQIVMSVREFSEFWIIDHNTTTEEAAGPAGDLLYRWGNPQAYGRGDESDRVLYYQHDAKWVEDGSPGAGNITVFNNGYGGPANPDVSSVVEITPPVDALGNYAALGPGEAHGPAVPTWTYTGPEANFSAIISGTQRLENGNTLITYGVNATFSEVTPEGVEVWKYVSPHVPGFTLGPEDPIPSAGIPIPGLDTLFANFTFRAIHYPVDFAPQFETSVTGGHVFYNDSGHDGHTPGIDPADRSAIATDKSGYLPGTGPITPESVTSYSKGINGIFVDLAIPAGELTLADFEFAMSEQGPAANSTPSTWAPAPAPTAFLVLTDTPSPGTDRVEFIWANNAIENRYLEVTVKGNDDAGGFNTQTGLAETNWFYYGNRIGDTFVENFPGMSTTVGDEIDARNHQGIALSVINAYDFNKDFFVNATDQLIARNNLGSLAFIDIVSPIVIPPAPFAVSSDDSPDAGVSSDLVAETNVPSDLVPVTREPTTDSARRFWHQLGDASDARASSLLGSVDHELPELLLSSIGKRRARFRGR